METSSYSLEINWILNQCANVENLANSRKLKIVQNTINSDIQSCFIALADTNLVDIFF